ncbi:hypothetical protein SMD14_13005 [Pseudarthrobacter oxydans]|nr:hypothetical protein [Pseudarthrobacter oxydans]WPU08083.1 hypothetical protein SMD14_13005 [Pseudarthrobacter oxydans]
MIISAGSSRTTTTSGLGYRPYLVPRMWSWKDTERNTTPGIGLFRGQELKAHLTPDEARALADKLHDMADNLQDTIEQEN